MLPDIFSIQTDADFVQAALQTFGYQYHHNQVYQRFCTLLGRTPDKVRQLTDIPFLPIEFFKSEVVHCGNERPTTVFTSSGTTGSQTSRHYVKDLAVYQQSFRQGFADFYGNIEEYTVLALLPSYLERTGSSLITMVADLIERSGSADSGFYLNEYDLLAKKLTALDRSGRKVLLIGVSFALLDLVETHRFQLKNTIVMETGGMKGRRKELIREELHAIPCEGFGVEYIHSEYGMTDQPYIRMLQNLTLAEVLDQIRSDHAFEIQEQEALRQAELQKQKEKIVETTPTALVVDSETGEIIENTPTIEEANIPEPKRYRQKMTLEVYFEDSDDKDRFKRLLSENGWEYKQNYTVSGYQNIASMTEEELKIHLN